VTQLFDRGDKYLESDSVFAVKDSLIVEFRPAPEGSDVKYVVDYDIRLVPWESSSRVAAE
jgi:catechol 1,2-dioxygenase